MRTEDEIQVLLTKSALLGTLNKTLHIITKRSCGLQSLTKDLRRSLQDVD